MKMRELTIDKQLKFGFGTLMVIVLIMGIFGYISLNLMHDWTVELYNHNLLVRRAIGSLTTETNTMSIGLRDLLLADSGEKKVSALEEIQVAKARVEQTWPALRERYLGSREDIESAYQAYMLWLSSLENLIETARGGDVLTAKDGLQPGGRYDLYREQFLGKILTIDQVARNKGDELYAQSIRFGKIIEFALIFIVLAMLIVAYQISKFIYGNIKNPLDILNKVARDVQKSNLATRCNLENKTEFGQFAAVFDQMLESIELNDSLNQKSASLSGVMLSQEDAKTFFQLTLSMLSKHTGAQISAVYLLSENKKTYELFDSIGMDAAMRHSFNGESLEGELGLAVASKKIQQLKLTDVTTRFVYPTASGSFLPQEIITIPIAPGDDVIAVITLATVNRFSGQAMELLEDTLAVMSARIQGILAYRKVNHLKDELDEKNQELERQQVELKEQALELAMQNRELERQKEGLGELNRLKTSFLSNMSHELRTPLNSVIALSGVLSRRLAGQIPDEEHGYLGVIERSGKSLLELINDILDISKIESGKIDIDVKTFNLSNLIGDVKAILDPLAKQKSIEIIYDQTDKDIFIESDEGKCGHVIQNLLSNAVKFTEEGHVRITVSLQENTVDIIIKDTGIGISEKQIPHIFDEFRQADGSTTRKFGGTGLGLAIAQKYSKLLGGRVEVASILGKGSTFTFTLPLKYTSGDSIRPIETKIGNDIEYRNYFRPRTINSGVSLAPRRILVVEDSEPAVVQIRDVLEEAGHQVIVAHDGIEALELIKGYVPDAIVLDLMMPRADGFQVLKTLREDERTAHVPVLILTAKHISVDELSVLRQNNAQQLILKGNVDRFALQRAVANLFYSGKQEEKAGENEQQETVVKTRQKNEKTDRNEQPVSAEKPIVLVVEDNPDNMLTVRALLKEKFTVIEAVDGEQSVDLAKAHVPDLILMDIALPGIDGVDAFKAIRKNQATAHIPVIALAASVLTTDLEILLAYGFDAYITKPIIEKQFMKIIEGVLYGK